MGYQPPFRMPCEVEANQPPWLSSPFQHNLGDQTADKFTLSTQVDNWDTTPGQPPTIAPFERLNNIGLPACADAPDCGTGNPPCSAWLLPLDVNTWSHIDGDKVNFAVAHKRGFKNVQGRRIPNGRFGYLDIEASGASDTWCANSDPSTSLNWRSYKSAPLQTRYLQLAISSTWEWVHNEWSGPPESTTPTTTTTDQSASVTQVINSAGILNTTALALSPNTSQTEPLTEFPQQAFAALQKGFKHFGDVVTDMISGTISDATSTTWTATSLTVTNSFQIETINWDIGAGTFHRVIQQNYPDAGGYLTILDEMYTLTETGLAYSLVTYNRIGDPGPAQGLVIDQITTNVTGTLSSAITGAALLADIVDNLLSLWPLNDDKLYPWRTDSQVGLAPLVSRDEFQTQEFDSANFYLRDYNVPIVDPLGHTIGDPDWEGNTGYTINPNPQTGTYRTAIDFAGHNSGSTVDIQINPNFTHTTAAITYTVIGGSFPSGVTMDASGHITGTVGDDGHWGVTIEATCGIAAFSGAILGGPKPAGYQNYFNFQFEDIRGCCFHDLVAGTVTWNWYLFGWGQDVVTFNVNSGCQLPLNATQWNSWFDAANKPAGAWIFYADKGDYFPADCVTSAAGAHSGAGDAGMLVVQKWAEIKEDWPSQNFAMPAGDAKFWLNEDHVFCAVNISGSGEGSTWTITDALTGIAPPDGTDFSGTWGGMIVNGFYTVASYSGGTLTLGAKQFDLPSNWHSKSNTEAPVDGLQDDDFCFGKLRWSDKPSLLGRAAITTAGTSATFAVAQPAFGMNSATHQEQVDIYDASMTLLAANVTATRINDSSYSTSASYPTAAWVQITGTPKWYVNDADPKGDYTILEWTSDFRSFGEYGRLTDTLDCSGTQVTRPTANAGGGPIDAATQFAAFSQAQCCLPFKPCGPRVICVSPNGEVFPNGITYAFPATFICDDTWGSKWWKLPQTTMTDLFWQKPHRPCHIESCALWTQDSGICDDDTAGVCPPTEETPAPEYFFGHPPQVEARLTVPSVADVCGHAYGADQDEAGPALPTGIQIGWLSPVDHTAGEIAFPPPPAGVSSGTGVPVAAETAWSLHKRFCDAGVCRFGYPRLNCDS